jgi:hypothetical protein
MKRAREEDDDVPLSASDASVTVLCGEAKALCLQLKHVIEGRNHGKEQVEGAGESVVTSVWSEENMKTMAIVSVLRRRIRQIHFALQEVSSLTQAVSQRILAVVFDREFRETMPWMRCLFRNRIFSIKSCILQRRLSLCFEFDLKLMIFL